MPVDPLPVGQGGKPPYDHPRRCQGIRRCGLRCERWALRGSKFCQFHKGRKNRLSYWNQHVSKFYARALTDTLKARVEEHLSQKPDDQISLFEELALMREAASQHVTIYNAVLQHGKQESVLAAAELMALSLSRVADICKSAATVHNIQKDKFSIHDLNFIIEQIIRISYDVIKDEAIATQLAIRLRSELQLTSNVGTTITTDQMVQQMDHETAPPPQ